MKVHINTIHRTLEYLEKAKVNKMTQSINMKNLRRTIFLILTLSLFLVSCATEEIEELSFTGTFEEDLEGYKRSAEFKYLQKKYPKQALQGLKILQQENNSWIITDKNITFFWTVLDQHQYTQNYTIIDRQGNSIRTLFELQQNDPAQRKMLIEVIDENRMILTEKRQSGEVVRKFLKRSWVDGRHPHINPIDYGKYVIPLYLDPGPTEKQRKWGNFTLDLKGQESRVSHNFGPFDNDVTAIITFHNVKSADLKNLKVKIKADKIGKEDQGRSYANKAQRKTIYVKHNSKFVIAKKSEDKEYGNYICELQFPKGKFKDSRMAFFERNPHAIAVIEVIE